MRLDPVGHREEVADRQPQIAQHPPDVVGPSVAAARRIEPAVDLEVHDRLAVQGARGPR